MREYFKNSDGQCVVEAVILDIQNNKAYLGEIDGLIGDGDHGMNMNKGFSLTQKKLQENPENFSGSLEVLGMTLFNEIGGSMGPIYGTVFMNMAETTHDEEKINLVVFAHMLKSALRALSDIVDAKPGDKTLIDTLDAASNALQNSIKKQASFYEALDDMKIASEAAKESTKDMIAKFGRSSRLGERSRGVLDAGACSCNIILQAMANEIQTIL